MTWIPSLRRHRPSLAAALVCVLALGGVPNASAATAPRKNPSCTKQLDGTTEVDTLAARAGASPPYLLAESSSHDSTTGAVTFHQAVTRGQQNVLTVDVVVSASQLTLTTTYGKGFKGIATSVLTREGDMFRGVVDGRRTALFGATTDPKTVAFEDGQPAPRLRIRPDLKKALKKFAGLSLDTCKRVPKSKGAVRPQDSTLNCPYTDDLGLCEPFPGCNNCDRLCFASYISCGIGAVTSAAVCIPCAFVSGASCIEEENACSQLCQAPGHPCCPLSCEGHCSGGATGDACCGGEACAPDECCGTTNPFCCGTGNTCADRNLGICCPDTHGPVCNNGCCNSGESCVDGFNNTKTCCATGSNACGPDNTCCPASQDCCGSNCCGPGQTCIQPVTCCNVADVCGSTCCPSHNCVNGTTCCDAPNFQCGANCCGALDSCCNGQCCNGQCLNNGSTCCPPERACGASCCAVGFACTDPAHGTCQQCPGGEDPCPAGQGDPLCCATGTLCCGNGQCCDTSADMTCCATASGPACIPTSSCVR